MLNKEKEARDLRGRGEWEELEKGKRMEGNDVIAF